MEPIHIPIDGTLDLHTFNPKELPELLEDYLVECMAQSIFRVRIIHGKGKGIQKARVHALLAKNSLVVSYRDAPAQAGGWGATIVDLKQS